MVANPLSPVKPHKKSGGERKSTPRRIFCEVGLPAVLNIQRLLIAVQQA